MKTCWATQTRAVEHEFWKQVLKPSSGSAWWRCPSLSLCVTHPSSTSFLLYFRGAWVFPFHKATPKASRFWPLRFTEGYLIIAAVWVARWYKKAHQTKCFSQDIAARRKDKSLFFHFKTLVDCGYRNVSGRSVNLFFIFLCPQCICWDWKSRIRSKSTT